MVPVYLDGGGVLVIPITIYVAGLKLGKQLQRREALRRRVSIQRQAGQWPAG